MVIFAEEVVSSRREALWWRRLVSKRECLCVGRAGLYLYHTRKAAGTSLREVLTRAARKYRVRMWETEGLSVDARFLAMKSAVTVVSVRHPVDRALSLYWYEHVGWWDGVKKDHSKLRTLSEWIDEWQDGSPWKRNFAEKNPKNVYVEVQNYFTKMLSAEGDLEKAKLALERFDVIFVCERSKRPEHLALLSAALNFHVDFTKAPASNVFDAKPHQRLEASLAPNISRARQTLTELNDRDLNFYSFALDLDDRRTNYYAKKASLIITPSRHEDAEGTTKENIVCDTPPARQLDSVNGIFRPPGHKH